MKFQLLLPILFLSVFFTNLSSQASTATYKFATTHSLQSKILKEERLLNVYLPAGYHPDSTQTYPVLYVLDGSAGEDFTHLAGLVDYVNLYQLLPPTIVVGIANVDRQRDFTYPSSDSLDLKYLPTSGSSENFQSFLKKEVFPYVEANFNTNNQRSLVGQSLGGLLATEILLKQTVMFDDYFIVSPSLWWDQRSLLKNINQQLATFSTLAKPTRVYLSVGREHPEMNAVADSLASALRKVNSDQLKFYYHPNLEEDHATILHAAIYDAFKTFHRTDKSLKIAFGSCAYEEHPLPIFDEVVRHDPDLFIFLGDNIYGDTKDMDVLRQKYQKLADKPTFQRLKERVPLLATWDDHDYGWNDAGRHYSQKNASREIFLDFWEEPKASERRKRPGIYASEIRQVGDKKVQILLLDTRTFRDDLLRNKKEKHPDRRYFYHLDYTPHTSSDSTLLGEAQWKWLGEQLADSADVRIIASSTQFGIEYNGYEAWANYPHERQKMLELIKEKSAEGVLFISGDVHYAEISKLETPDLYPIYDITSSGLSSTWHFATPNVNRIEGPIMDNHFGLMTIDFTGTPSLKMEIWDVNGNQRIEYSIGLSQLKFPANGPKR